MSSLTHACLTPKESNVYSPENARCYKPTSPSGVEHSYDINSWNSCQEIPRTMANYFDLTI